MHILLIRPDTKCCLQDDLARVEEAYKQTKRVFISHPNKIRAKKELNKAISAAREKAREMFPEETKGREVGISYIPQEGFFIKIKVPCINDDAA